MKIGKILLAALAVTVFNVIVGGVFCGGIFSWVYKLEPINVWKPLADGHPGVMFLICSLVLNAILSLVYVLVNKGIPGSNRVTKGAVFGLCVWAVGMLPGMLATYTFMTVATTAVVYWTILGLFTSPLKGIIIAMIYGE